MPERYRFGAVEIDPLARRVLINGAAAPLQARAFDLLLALVEHRDRVLGRAELYDLVWAGRVVEDNNLAVQVHALRKLLGERAVVTVPGRGYRFALAAGGDVDERQGVRATDERRVATVTAQLASALAAALPVSATALLGREDELAVLDELLAQHRLVSVVGAGGIGKTVVALAAARSRCAAQRDGAAWVELAQVLDPALLAGTVAQAFGLQVAGGADPIRSLVGALERA